MKKKKTTTDFGLFIESQVAKDAELQRDVCTAELHLEIASAVYELRESMGFSQSELAAKAGTQQSVISRIEDADYEGHSLNLLNRIAMACGKRLDIGFCSRSSSQSLSLQPWAVPLDIPTSGVSR